MGATSTNSSVGASAIRCVFGNLEEELRFLSSVLRSIWFLQPGRLAIQEGVQAAMRPSVEPKSCWLLQRVNLRVIRLFFSPHLDGFRRTLMADSRQASVPALNVGSDQGSFFFGTIGPANLSCCNQAALQRGVQAG